jgi:hypothetical protein
MQEILLSQLSQFGMHWEQLLVEEFKKYPVGQVDEAKFRKAKINTKI